MEGDPALSVYSEAKSEYMFQLCSYLAPAYYAFYVDLYERAKQETTSEPKKQLWQLQNLLAEMEDWNMERVSREVSGIQVRANCDFLDDLLTAVFVAHTKVLTAIRINSKQKKVQLTVPKIDHFLLKVFIESSRLLWQNVYLFRDSAPGMEKQQNYRQIQTLVDNGIRAAIRAMVPVKNLLKDCLAGRDESDSDSDDEKPVHPVVKALLEPAAAEEVPAAAEEVPAAAEQEAPKNEIIPPHSQQLIIVDAEPQVTFSDYETIFDTENSDGNLIQAAHFPEAGDYDDEPGLEILDDIGTPFTADDCDDGEQSLGPLEAEEIR